MTRLAGAPISWGICEVPGWGYQMAPERVLREMRDAGLRATELGPPGYLPSDPDALRKLLDANEIQLAAGFVSIALHLPGHQGPALRELEAAADTIAGAGGDVLLVAAAAGGDYDRRRTLDRSGWSTLLEGLRRAQEIADARGLEVAFHPHAGTVVQSATEVSCLLELSDVGLCLDTGHLVIGGGDPVRMAATAGRRIRHVHLKDVDERLAKLVRSGDLAYSDAVRRGLFRPLGSGCVDVPGLVSRLGAAGYGGWFVLEQDVMLAAEPEPDSGPVADVRRSVAFLEGVAALKEQKGEERWQYS